MRLFNILYVLSAALIGFCTGDIPGCCEQGYNHGLKVTATQITCSDSDIDFSSIQDADRMMCSVIFMSCCSAAAERELCTEGLSMAMSGLNCTERAGPGGKAQKRCCNCCKGGVQQARQGGVCNVKQDSRFCTESFSVCCKNPGIGARITTKAPTTTSAVGAIKSKPTTVIKTTKPTTKAVLTTAAPTCFDLLCSHGCQYINDRAMCLCRTGFRLAADKQTCIDIDECKENLAKCGTNQVCKNTQGAYTCVTNIKKKKCSRAGYVNGPDGECVDEDECKKGVTCEDNKVCLNTDGSYVCLLSCPYGYEHKGNICEDIDECAIGNRKCPARFKCINDVGSHYCKRVSCESGYSLIDNSCHDIDECEERKDVCGVGGRCFNQRGSYYCICGSGYTRNPLTNKCQDLDECTRLQDSCAHKCVNTQGSYTCNCPRGYTITGRNCIDIDECSRSATSCPQGFSCHNTFGGFSCIRSTCPSNFYIQRSKYECKLYCPGSDACKHILEQSIKWIAYSFRKTLEREKFSFTYFVRINSYLSTTISFYLALGNEERNFYVQRIDKESAKIINVRKIVGPKEYNLRLHADVIYNGKTTTRFVYFFYLYFSEYDL